MRLFRTLFSFMIVAAIGISLITTCPTKTEFAKYYVSQSESKLGGFFDGALEKVVTQQTKASGIDCLIIDFWSENDMLASGDISLERHQQSRRRRPWKGCWRKQERVWEKRSRKFRN